VRLVVQIQRVRYQLLNVDLGRTFEPAPVPAIAASISTAFAAAAMRTAPALASTTGRASTLSLAFLIAWFLLRRFRHADLFFLRHSFSGQSGPF
jgi:hypothetical protein